MDEELYRSSRNGTSPEGTRDLGRTFQSAGTQALQIAAEIG